MRLPDGVARWVEQRISIQGPHADELDELIGAAPTRVLEWMRRKAQLADGTDVGLPVCDSVDVVAVVARERGCEGGWEIVEPGFTHDAWAVAEVGLLRDLCGSTQAEAAARTSTSTSGVARKHARHREWLMRREDYAVRVSCLAKRILEQAHGLPEEIALRIRAG